MVTSSFSALMSDEHMFDIKNIRVRYAPSPTGFLHIGGARSALFNYLFAKHHGGKFIIRIEDTDLERNVAGGEVSQINDLKWLGIIPDESPLEPNPQYAPYRQMERLESYQRYAKQLLDQGHAYSCYCSEEELERSREAQLARGIAAPQYDRRCLHLSPSEKEAFIAQGRKPVIRIRLEDHLKIDFTDMVRGPVSFNNDDIGDWVLIKSNGIPTYNFAVVIDDYLMDITHVFRGEEHLSNTPKQIQVYRYLNFPIPQFGHMTIIVNDQGKKLSKRDASIVQFMSQYRALGYLPEAIFNFILLLGWSPEGTQEIFTMKEAIAAFDAKRLSSSPSMFDPQKLNWINGHYIKQLSTDAYWQFISPFVVSLPRQHGIDDTMLQSITGLFKDQILFGQQMVDLVTPILSPLPPVEEEAKQILASEDGKKALRLFAEKLQQLSSLDAPSIKGIFKAIQAETGLKGKPLFMPVRLKLTGLLHGAELANLIPILGKALTLERLQA
jgi:nondiscriminating glutamyl-tRNA synthetase